MTSTHWTFPCKKTWLFWGCRRKSVSKIYELFVFTMPRFYILLSAAPRRTHEHYSGWYIQCHAQTHHWDVTGASLDSAFLYPLILTWKKNKTFVLTVRLDARGRAVAVKDAAAGVKQVEIFRWLKEKCREVFVETKEQKRVARSAPLCSQPIIIKV